MSVKWDCFTGCHSEGWQWMEKEMWCLCENRIMKSIKIIKIKDKGISKSNAGSEFSLTTVYACMGISHRTLLRN
jgi:hypothetical protein